MEFPAIGKLGHFSALGKEALVRGRAIIREPEARELVCSVQYLFCPATFSEVSWLKLRSRLGRMVHCGLKIQMVWLR
jgi:hypothetical protein